MLTTYHIVLSGAHKFNPLVEWVIRSHLSISQFPPEECILAGTHFPSHWRQENKKAWVAGYNPRWYTIEQSPISLLTTLDVQQLHWCDQCYNHYAKVLLHFTLLSKVCLNCFNTVGWAASKASGLQKIEWWDAGMVICLEQWSKVQMICIWSSWP